MKRINLRSLSDDELREINRECTKRQSDIDQYMDKFDESLRTIRHAMPFMSIQAECKNILGERALG